MPGRIIPSEPDLLTHGHGLARSDFMQRRAVLRETLQAFTGAEPPDHYHRLAAANLERWYEQRQNHNANGTVLVCPDDWGKVTLSLTKTYGHCFAVLNMANAYVPGGAYVEGAPAQEENMFRRTDCHFSIGPDEYDAVQDRYLPHMTQLLSAQDSVVYLDTARPRVCIRGPENRSADDLGYPWLAEDQVFPFFELRAAAQDLRGGSVFDAGEARRRIAAQLDTLRAHHIRHVVLSAFGCGAFQNPAAEVAQLYKEELDKYHSDFSASAFAIFAPGYGPDNYRPFKQVFEHSSKSD